IVNDAVLSQTDQLSASGVNGKPFSIERMDFAAARNQDLRWRISEGSDLMLHPVHIHGCQFRIISRDGKPPEAERAGWKDVAPISAGGVTEIWCGSRIRRTETPHIWRTVTFWSTRIPG